MRTQQLFAGGGRVYLAEAVPPPPSAQEVKGKKAPLPPHTTRLVGLDVETGQKAWQCDDLYDQWGGWEFSPADGSMIGVLGAICQPGWPNGRLTPGDPALELSQRREDVEVYPMLRDGHREPLGIG